MFFVLTTTSSASELEKLFYNFLLIIEVILNINNFFSKILVNIIW